MSVTEVHKEALIDFGKDVCARYYEDFAPFASGDPTADHRFSPPATAFGTYTADFYYTSNPANLSFEYKPMTPEEFQEYGGGDLSGWEDPGGPMGGWEEFWNAGSYLSPVSWVELGFGSHNSQNPWYDYYEAVAGVDSPKSYPAPTDDAPWAKSLKDGWDACVENRRSEVDEIRGELLYLLRALATAAEVYADTDLVNAVDLDALDDVSIPGEAHVEPK